MTNNFLNKLKEESNFTLTQNGAKTLESSLNELVDFFALGGAYRNRSEEDFIKLFSKAFATNKNDTLKILFYLRDIRGGQGERKIFRTALKYIGNNEKLTPSQLLELFDLVAEYGRYDDLFILFETPLKDKILGLINLQVVTDLDAEYPTLLGKWLKSINTSSPKSREIGHTIRKFMGLKESKYRKVLSKLRRKIDIVETHMSKKDYTFDYSRVPSKAMLQYRSAFGRNDTVKFGNYLDSVKKGEKKINAGTLYPYEIVGKIREGYYDNTLEELWKNLPDYVVDNGNSIVVADVSGSMIGTPMNVSISLAMYLAERNKGQFKDYFITFSNRPKLQKVIGNNLKEKVNNLSKAEWEMSTNLQAVFDLILNTATQNRIPENEMLKTIYIVSDMEFNRACPYDLNTNFEIIKQKYINAGYQIPNLVFWNVDAKQDQSPVKYDQTGTMLVSGCSPSIFKQTIERVTPEQFMYQVINSPRYKDIKLFL